MNKEVAKLWLYFKTMNTTINPNTGYEIGAGQNNYVWFVDMREVLGETLWTNYDAFLVNLCPQLRINTAPYVYIGGLNLTQTSQNGAQQGGDALAFTLVQPYGTSDDRTLDSWSGNYLYTMIKPADNRIQMKIYWTPMTGSTGTGEFGSFFFTFQGLKTRNPLYKNPFNNFYNIEQRTFTLTTQGLIAGGTNEIGTMNASYSTFSFNNLNFRNILGTMWNKYEKFNMTITSVGTGTSGTTSFAGDSTNNYVVVEGLQFINSVTLGVSSTKFINRYATSGAYVSETATGRASSSGNIQDGYVSTTTFRKPESENVTLTIGIGGVGQGFPSTAFTWNNWAITFRIVGVKNDE